MGPTVLEPILAILIVDVPLLFIRQYLVSCIEFLELLLVATSVWVVLQSQLSECLSDLIIRGFLVNAEQLVVL